MATPEIALARLREDKSALEDVHQPEPDPHRLHPNSEDSSSWLLRPLFAFASALLVRGSRDPLQYGDLHDLPRGTHATASHDAFERAWRERPQRSLAATLFALYPEYGLSVLLSSTFSVFMALGPVILRRVVEWVSQAGEDRSLAEGLGYAALLLLPTVVGSICIQNSDHINVRLSIRARGAMTAAIYRKATRLSSAAAARYTTGEITNLVAVHAQRLNDYAFFLNWAINCPIILGIVLSLFAFEVGLALLPALAVLALCLRASSWLSRKVVAAEEARSAASDVRLKRLSEIVSGMQIVKFYGWARAVTAAVEADREEELRHLRAILRLKSSSAVVMNSTDYLLSTLVFAFYVLVQGEELTAAKTFTVLGLLYTMRLPLIILPLLVPSVAQLRVSINAVEAFLREEERDSQYVVVEAARAPGSLQFAGPAAFAWAEASAAKPELRDVAFALQPGALLGVVGPVGGGKSSLIAAILGDMRHVRGEVRRGPGGVAYVPQRAWIVNDTIRNNVLMGRAFDADRFWTVVRACALDTDIELFAAREHTEIGERGTTLSGGQMQRVSLARAAYDTDAALYLLDDPLSAVDAHVAEHIFAKLIRGLLRDKTVVLATHALHLLPAADHVVVLSGGAQVEAGSFAALSALEGGVLRGLLAVGGVVVGPAGGAAAVSSSSVGENGEDEDEEDHGDDDGNDDEEDGKLTRAEDRETGVVKRHVFERYLQAGLGGRPVAVLFLCVYLAESAARVSADGWLNAWQDAHVTQEDPPPDSFFVGVHVGLVGAFVLVMSVRMALFVAQLVQTSRTLHSDLLRTVVRAPMSFFDQTPIGRVVNRFSRDIAVVDLLLPNNLTDLWTTSEHGFIAVVVAAYAMPVVLAPFALLSVWYVRTQRYYRASARELQRLESITRSPVLSHVAETVDGVATIRAFGLAPLFQRRVEVALDRNSVALYNQRIVERWLAVRMESIGGFVSIFTALVSVLTVHATADDLTEEERAWLAGLVGLGLAYSLSLPGYVNWLTRMVAEVESRLTSVERLLAFAEMPTEPEPAPAAAVGQWTPSAGAVELRGLTVVYRPGLPPVLDGVSLQFPAGSKVGIVGRTGAGKSSLVAALFRIMPVAPGQIFIDGVDTAAVPLDELRAGVTIIPQTPVLFAGTVRSNLDPFGVYSDADMRAALEHAQLAGFALGDAVAPAGDNLSQGQRQLVCLARALLRRPRVLVLDEATSSVDVETDALVQRVVRAEFADATVLTIAHRVSTILDSSMVVVLDAGRVVELGAPEELRGREGGVFAGLVAASSM